MVENGDLFLLYMVRDTKIPFSALLANWDVLQEQVLFLHYAV
jgi:hypothetical protein